MPLPGKGLTTWIAHGVTASKLRLHPTAEEEPLARLEPNHPFAGRGKKILLALAIGLGAGAIGKACFLSTRYYRAEGRIAIQGLRDGATQQAFQRHLFELQTGELVIAPEDPNETVSLRSMIDEGTASVFPSGDHTISLLVTDSDPRDARMLANQFIQAYTGKIITRQNALSRKLNDNQAKILAQYQQLQQERDTLKAKTRTLADGLPTETMDAYLAKMTKTLEGRVQESDQLLKTLNQVNADIAHYRGEIIHPTINIDEARLARMKGADRRYSGDYNLLTSKHQMYLANLKPEMQGLTDALETLRHHLKLASEALTKQLGMKLPGELSDDLLELSLAVEKYDGQLARFQERWTRYGEKLLTLLAQPDTADFEGMQTLLSQLRQDLMQRCSQMPDHLDGLYQQLRKGQSKNGKQGKLSDLTARNVASSAVAGDLEQTLQAWRKLSFHLTRMFPDGNVNLLTLGRICRSLQWRLTFRGKQLRQELEEQQRIAQQREAQVRLNALQKDFERTSKGLVGAFQKFSDDERLMAEISRRWPEAQRAKEALAMLNERMTEMEKELGIAAGGPVELEKLEALPVIVRRYNHAGLSPRGENVWALMLTLAGAIAAAALLMPSAFATLWTQTIRPRLRHTNCI